MVTVTGGGATTVTGTYPNFTITSTDTKGDADSSTTNELQNLSITGRQLSISKGNSVYVPADADSSTTNELQTISRTNGTITLSNGGGSIALPDSSATNELQNITITGGRINLSNSGGTIYLPDSSSTNELQTLTRKADTLFLTNGGKVTLPDSNEWVKNGTSISYNKGNVGIGTTAPIEKLSVAGKIESTTGGFKFPDSTVQITAAHTYHAGKGILLKNDTFTLDTNYVLQNLAFNPQYPDGVSNTTPVLINLNSTTPTYTVPANMNLYVNTVNCSILSIDSNFFRVFGVKSYSSPVFAGAGQIIKFFSSPSSANGRITGYLISTKVTPISMTFSNTSYTVPSGKRLFITNVDSDESFAVDGDSYFSGSLSLSNPIIVKSGQVISFNGANKAGVINGYLK
ncbi:MAG: hypothetical protein NTX03_06375 [Bacteroidetes bacterium]|nr:hypothetical protein [Bacteroidota bacterium]